MGWLARSGDPLLEDLDAGAQLGQLGDEGAGLPVRIGAVTVTVGGLAVGSRAVEGRWAPPGWSVERGSAPGAHTAPAGAHEGHISVTYRVT